MVTKGIITSIDFNGNTCQVRIPFFETAGNDPIIGTAIVSNTPGSYNGYKVDDVVLVAFEDGQMETPVIIGKLYLGAEKEKADPRGSLNTESLVAAKAAAVPADTKLTTNTDKNLPNTMNPYANLSSIANNLNKLNTDVNYLDAFTNNQFNSIITELGDDGKLWTAINQNSSDISMRAMMEQDAKTTGFGWNLDVKGWTLNTYKDEKIVPIFKAGNSGVAITGDLKLVDYPSTTITKYAHIPANWYKSEDPRTDWIIIDNEIAYAKSPNYNSLKDIEETWKAEDVAAFPEGAGVKVGDKIWQDEQPNVDANYYTWKLTYRLTYEYNSNDDLLVEVLTDQSVFCIYYETESSDETPIKRNPPKKDEIPLPEVYETATMAHKTATTAQVIAQGKTTNYYSDLEPYAADQAPKGYLAAPSLKKGDCWFDISDSGKRNETTIELTWNEKWNFENSSDHDPNAYIFSLPGNFERYADATNTRGIGKLSRGEWVKSSGLENIKNLSMCFLDEYNEASPSQTANKLALIIPKTITVLVANGEEITEEPVKSVDNLKLWFEQNGSITVIYQNWSTHANILKQAKTDPDTGTHLVEWEDIGGELVANKLTANYINALDITAKKIQVNDVNGNILFKANGISGDADSNQVTIGGFYVTKDALVGGGITTQNYCKLNILDTFNSWDPNKIPSSSLVIAKPENNDSENNGSEGSKNTDEISGSGDSTNYADSTDASNSENINEYYWGSKYCEHLTSGVTWEKVEYNQDLGTTQAQQCIYNGFTTYKWNNGNTWKNNNPGNIIQITEGDKTENKVENIAISCIVLKPNKSFIEGKIRDALNIKDGTLPSITFSTTINLGIESPTDTSSLPNGQYDYIIASTPFSFADLSIEISPDVTNEDEFIQNKIKETIQKIISSNLDVANVDDQGIQKLSLGIFTGYGKIQEYARATGPRQIGNLENLTKVIYPSLTTDHYIAIFMINVQQNHFTNTTTTSTYVYDYDSAGNIVGKTELKKDATSEYTVPVYGYCCVPNSIEVALQALEIGTNFKVRTDGTMVANNAFVTGTLNIPDTAVIGGFNISKNTLTSSALSITNNKVNIASYKPLTLGHNFNLVSTQDSISTKDVSGSTTTKKVWKSKISSQDPLEILGENSLLISNNIILNKTDTDTQTESGTQSAAENTEPTKNPNASILLETIAGKGGSTSSQEIRVSTDKGVSFVNSSGSSGSTTFAIQRPNPNMHIVDLSGPGGSVSTRYTTKATITATVYSDSSSTTAVIAEEAYKITVYYKFGTAWSSTTLAIPKGQNTASTTVSMSSSSSSPVYYGISASTSSYASTGNDVLKYTRYYTTNAATYTPKITANGDLTVEGNVYGDAFYASSDRDLKTNIEPINLDYNLDKFYRQLQPVKFNFKTDLNARHFGFIAQDLNEALSIISTDNTTYSIVNKDDKTGYYKVNYNEMVALNAAQIKNIMNYIKDLQSQYEALKLKYKELEEKINENR